MRLKYSPRKTPDGASAIAEMFKDWASPPNDYGTLEIGKEYVALGLTFWKGRAWVEMAIEGGLLHSFLFSEFEIVSGRPSRYWEARQDDDGTVRIWPPSFFEAYYHSRLTDGDPTVVADFKRVQMQLEEEDRNPLALVP